MKKFSKINENNSEYVLSETINLTRVFDLANIDYNTNHNWLYYEFPRKLKKKLINKLIDHNGEKIRVKKVGVLLHYESLDQRAHTTWEAYITDTRDKVHIVPSNQTINVYSVTSKSEVDPYGEEDWSPI